MEDVGATHGYLVCPVGHTKAAEIRAQMAVSISLIPVDRIENFDPSTWPKCQNSSCKHGRVFWDGYPELSVGLKSVDASVAASRDRQSYLHFVGKCDRCHTFHVQCQTCDELFVVPESDDDDVGHQCECRPPWFWLASIEEDAEDQKSAELHVILATFEILTVDRRPA